jgi:hypothetical protein
MDNKLYTYTSMTEMLASFIETVGWLRVKQGLTLKQEINDRIKQQDNASSTADLVPLSVLVIPNNDDTKLDDKVRELQHQTENFMHYDRFDNKNKKHEWSLVKIDDLVQDFDKKIELFKDSKNPSEFLAEHFLYNTEFLEKLNNRIYQSKKDAIKILLGTDSYKEIILRPWQEDVKNEMLKENKKFNLLSLAPRFGKTFTILDYAKDYAEKNSLENLVLLPASKNLSSNSSFVTDFYDGGYHIHGGFSIITDGSLFQDESKLIDRLKEVIPENSKVIMVTDEADVASHTEISQEKMKTIETEFNIIKHIAMSGTGIYKAAKIFRGISEDDIFFKSVNYTELSDYDSEELVKRNFYSIKYDMEEIVENIKNTLKSEGKDLNDEKTQKKMEILNINQAFSQIYAHKKLSSYIRRFIVDDEIKEMLNLKKSKVTMIFTPSRSKRELNKFVKTFASENPDIETMIITGDETTNAEAQRITKDKIRKMRQLKDDRALVIFSMAMGSRSYSVPEIRRVIIMGDGFINAPWYQKSARCLTYDFSKKFSEPIQEADIIRISFEKCNIAAELFLVENEIVDRSDETVKKMHKQLNRNTFTDVTFDDGDLVIGELQVTEISVKEVIDDVLKYTDSTKYIMSQLWEESLEIDKNLSNKNAPKKSKVKSVSLKVPNIKGNGIDVSSTKNIDLSGKKSKKDEIALEHYINIIRTLPYVAKGFNYTYDDLLKVNWNGFIAISKKDFLENLKNSNFKSIVESIFRNSLNDDSITLEKIEEYTGLI